MKRIGLIGGLGPEATVDYYQRLVARYRALAPGFGYPDLVIDNVDVDRVRALFERGNLDELTDYLVRSCERLAGAEADLAAMTANTVHLVFEQVAARSPIPLVSIVEATRDAAHARGMSVLGLFGTNFLMEAPLYPQAFAAVGMNILLPTPEERERIHRIYLDELIVGNFLDASRMELLAIATRMKADQRIEGLILGGTELPLILTPEHEARAGVPFLDTSALHVDAILAQALP